MVLWRQLARSESTAASLSAAAPVYTDWSAPVNLGPVVNSTFAETNPALSPDGLSLYFDSNRPGGFGGRDLWVSQRATVSGRLGSAGEPRQHDQLESDDANVRRSHRTGTGCSSPAPVPAGSAPSDLYQSYRADIHDDFGWQTPTNLGAERQHRGERERHERLLRQRRPPAALLRQRPAGRAGQRRHLHDQSQPDGTWGSATLVTELSSASTDNRPNLRPDGLEIFFYSDRPGGQGGTDLWTSTRATTDATWSTPVNLGPIVNTSASDVHPYVSADGQDARLRLRPPRRLRGLRPVDDDACREAHRHGERPEQAVRPAEPAADLHDQRLRRRRHLRRRLRHRRVHDDRDGRPARPGPTRSPAPRAR